MGVGVAGLPEGLRGTQGSHPCLCSLGGSLTAPSFLPWVPQPEGETGVSTPFGKVQEVNESNARNSTQEMNFTEDRNLGLG